MERNGLILISTIISAIWFETIFKRLDKEQKGEDAPDVSNVIEIKGDDAKKLVDTLCGILRKDK